MGSLKEILEGKAITLQWNVGRENTHDGLLSTAALTRYLLDTAWRLLNPELSGEDTSVTAMVQVSHEEPTPAGETVTVEARITDVTNNIVRIAFKAVDETGVIAHGFNERHIVNKANLLSLAESRAASLKNIT
jgi:predicted thioesterase